jgi:rod shape-determining protein MreB
MLSLGSSDLAIDLGTSNTLVVVRGRGIVVDEPSVVAVERMGGAQRVVAIGHEARQMIGRTPENIEAIHPIQDGVIVDFDLAEALLRNCIERALGTRPFVKPRVVVCVPNRLQDVERRAIQDAARSVGAKEVFLIGKPIAAAIGAQLPIDRPLGNMVIDVGGGTTEVGIISLGGVVVTRSAQVGGNHFDSAITQWIRDRHNVLVGQRTSEDTKLQVGSAVHSEHTRQTRVTGRDLSSGIPREIQITSDDISDAISDCLDQVVECLRSALKESPPELAADITDQGLVLCGGSALLPGLDRFLRDRTGLPIVLSEDPRRSAAIGAGFLLDDQATLDRVAF